VKSGKTVLRKLRALTIRTLPLVVTCQELEGFMVDYLEGTLPRGQRRKFELHLRLCRDCRRYLKGYKRTITLSQTACHEPDAPVPKDMPEALVKAILAARDEEP
jgi:predicted anti-sigma-YlaC factor YlaD